MALGQGHRHDKYLKVASYSEMMSHFIYINMLRGAYYCTLNA